MPSAAIVAPSLHRSILQKTLYLACVGAAVFFIPYLVPVSPSISLSYIAGFSNRTAIILFVVGIALFAVFTRGEIAAIEEGDGGLPVMALVISSAIVLLLCLARMNSSIHGHVGNSELEYAFESAADACSGFSPLHAI
jgi:hypothetical protein